MRADVTFRYYSARCGSRNSRLRAISTAVDGIFEIVRVVSRSLIPIAEVHAIITRAHFAQREAEMARDRFRFLERHGFLNRHREAVAIQLPAKARS